MTASLWRALRQHGRASSLFLTTFRAHLWHWLGREVADSSKGVAAALQAVAHYQRRSDAVLVHLLGRSYGARCPTTAQ